MNLFSRIAIGTANWGQEYNGARVSDHDQQEIIGYAQCSGITTIDTATAYGVDWTKWPTCFDVVVKVRQGDDIDRVEDSRPYCLMAHDGPKSPVGMDSDSLWGISCYSIADAYAYRPDVLQVPFSLWDRRFEQVIAESYGEIHVRSIFLRGKILEAGVSPEECVKFCLCNPHVDKVIVGADSFEQFRQSVGWIHEWNKMQKHDETLLDPRQWEKATEIHKET